MLHMAQGIPEGRSDDQLPEIWSSIHSLYGFGTKRVQIIVTRSCQRALWQHIMHVDISSNI